MSTTSSLALPLPEGRISAPALLTMYALETRYEFVKLLRLPHYIIGVLGFPVMFYLLFGLSFASRGEGPKASEWLLAGYAVFGAVTAALFAFGVGVSTERASGWMLLKQAAPLPTSVYLTAKVLTCMLFAGVIVAILAAMGVAFGGVRFTATAWLQLFSAVVLGCVPFCLFGLALGYLIPPAGAPGIVNLINLPLAFAGGLWLPYEMLPRLIKAISPFVPQYHLGRLALSSAGLVSDPALPHIAALAGFTVAGAACAAIAYRRSEQ